jgi:hypothetical protein
MVIALSVLNCSASAEAINQRGAYAGGALGLTSLRDDGIYDASNAEIGITANADLDEDSMGYQLFGGYRFLKYFALEARITYLGDYQVDFTGFTESGFPIIGNGNIQGDAKTEYIAFTLHGVGIYPLGTSGFDIYGQLGIGRFSADTSLSVQIMAQDEDVSFSSNFGDDDMGNLISVGLGARYTPKNFQAITINLGADLYAFEVEEGIVGSSHDLTITMLKLALQYNFMM